MRKRLLVSWASVLFAGLVVLGCDFFTNNGSTTTGATGFVYVLNSGGASGVGSVSGYQANASTGVLLSLVNSPFGVGAALSTPNSMSGDALGRVLYVSSNLGNGGINGFVISQSTNTLGQLTSAGVTATKAAPVAIAVDPAERAVYAVEAGPQVEGFAINTSTGALTAQANSPYSLVPPETAGVSPTCVTVAASGGFLFIGMNNGDILSVPINGDGTLGIATTVKTTPLAGVVNVAALAAAPTVTLLYAVDGTTNLSAYAINSSTGSLAALRSTPFSAGAGPIGVGVASVNGTPTYVFTANDGGTIGAFLISSSPALIPITNSPFPSPVTPAALAVDPSQNFLYIVSGGGSNQVLSFVIVGGALSAPGTSNPPTGTAPTAVVAVPCAGGSNVCG